MPPPNLSPFHLPSDWNSINCNLSRWGVCHLPLTKYDGGTATNFGRYVYLRRNFFISDTGEQLWLNVSADNGIALYLNGSMLPVSPALGAWNATRANLDYWNYRINITA